MGTLKEIFENDYQNRGVGFYSTEMFSENGFTKMELEMEKRELEVFK
jgi:hypothetical protein